MKGRIPEPLQDEVVERAATGDDAVEDALVQCQGHGALRDAVYGRPTIGVGGAHRAREVAMIGGFDLQDAEPARYCGHPRSVAPREVRPGAV